jgi:hypothetical protein
MRLYVIGPVTGKDGLNREAFESARRRLVEAGYIAAIPHDKVGEDDDWRTAMSKSIREMLSMRRGAPVYDGVAELPQCIGSKGARCERGICEQLGIPHRPVDEWVSEAEEKRGGR